MNRQELIQVLSSGQIDGFSILSDYAIKNGKKFSHADFQLLNVVNELQGTVMSIIDEMKREHQITEVSRDGRVVKYI